MFCFLLKQFIYPEKGLDFSPQPQLSTNTSNRYYESFLLVHNIRHTDMLIHIFFGLSKRASIAYIIREGDI